VSRSDERLRPFREGLEAIEAGGGRRVLWNIQSREGKHLTVNGRRLIDLSSNDYLGLACDAEVLREFFIHLAEAPTCRRSMGSGASRLLSGNSAGYADLEAEISSAYSGRAALVFASGYHANIGIIPALVEKGDIILSDRLNHASIIDGARLSGAERAVFGHLDYDEAEAILAARRAKSRRALIVTESIFSMDGDAADLVRLAEIARRYDALLYVDEAHAVGVFGERGLGLCSRDLPDGGADVIVGTFGKAIGGHGAFTVIDPVIRDWIINRCRTFIFSTALPPALAEWNRFAFNRMQSMDEHRRRLLANAARLRRALIEAGFEAPGAAQILPVILGDNRRAVRAAEILREEGYFVLPIRPPTVPEGSARLRLSLRSDIDLDEVLDIPRALTKVL